MHLLRVAQRTSSCSSRISTNCTFGSPLVTRQATGERSQLAFSRGRVLLRAVLLSLLRNCIRVKARRIPEARARHTLDETHLASREFQLRISDSVKSTSYLSLYLSIYLPLLLSLPFAFPSFPSLHSSPLSLPFYLSFPFFLSIPLLSPPFSFSLYLPTYLSFLPNKNSEGGPAHLFLSFPSVGNVDEIDS